MAHVILFADGSVRGNPGPAGIGGVVVDAEGNILRRFGEQIPPCTNNEAEYHALIRGLQVCQQLGAYSVTVRMDSELVRLQVLGHYRVQAPHLQALCEQARQLLGQFQQWTLEHIENERNLAHTYAQIASTQNRQHPSIARVYIETPETTKHRKGGTHMPYVVKPSITEIPEGIYIVKLLDVHETDGQFGKQFVWRFAIDAGEYRDMELRAWSNASTSQNSKALRWLSAFAGRTLKPGEQFELTDFVGKRAQANIFIAQREDGRRFAKIDTLFPLTEEQRKRFAQPAAAPAVTPQQKRVKDGMVAIPATSQGFYEDDDDPDDPFANDWEEDEALAEPA
ncbi:MAG: ribonuclease HI family protein [Armatimonadota bacterium]